MPPRGRSRGRGVGSLDALQNDARYNYNNANGYNSPQWLGEEGVPDGSAAPLPRLQLVVVQPGDNSALLTQPSNDVIPNSRNLTRGSRGMRGGAGGFRGRSSREEVSTPQHYGQIVDSDLVHDEIREVGELIKNVIKQNFQRHGTEKNQVLAGIRQFGPSKQSRKMLNKENEAARLAYEQGIYVVWRLLEEPRIRGANNDFCCRIGPRHRCFCGHAWSKHASPTLGSKKGPNRGEVSQKHPCEECDCKNFAYVPNEPEEIGEGWLTRRTNWDPAKWSAKCRCGHGHKEHHPVTRFCKSCGGCSGFQSHFLCVVCDMPWEAHQTVYETEAERHRAGFPVRQDYFPLSDIDWDIREMVLKDVTGGGVLQPPNDHNIHEVTDWEDNVENSKASPSPRSITNKPRQRKLPNITGTSGGGGQGGKGSSSDNALPAQGASCFNVGEYCPSCAGIYKITDVDSCGRCGRPRPGKR